jgi:hypothetical protein
MSKEPEANHGEYEINAWCFELFNASLIEIISASLASRAESVANRNSAA